MIITMIMINDDMIHDSSNDNTDSDNNHGDDARAGAAVL